jgi:bifunctional non-homologous end joining protein LigD
VTPQQLLRKVFPPMLATLADAPPADRKSWTYELKYDGFRALAALSGGEMAMWSRNELDLTGRFPAVAAAVSKLKLAEVVLDGEIVALDEKGAPRFQLLQQGEHRERIAFFDVLWLDGEDLRKRPYLERRAILEKLLRRAPAAVSVSEVLDMSGEEALKLAAKSGWEGIIAKRNTSLYEGRRSKEWLKVKAINEQEFVVIGWNPSAHSSREIGSLHLGFNDHGELRYAGKVGTGFSAKQRVWFKDELSKDVVPTAPAKDAPRERAATWVRPRFVVQVAFTEWTGDHRLRHPSFLGIREDKGVSEVVQEKPVKTKKVIGAKPDAKPKTKVANPSEKPAGRRTEDAGPTVLLTHPERILYPRDKITKQDVADYYDAVAEPMIRALRDRPLALEHWNQGIDHPAWFQQNVGKEAPPWATTIETPTRGSGGGKTVRHLVVDRPETLRWLAQMSVLTIHMWASRGASLDEPDWLVFDLDPAKGKGIEQAIDAAIVVRGLLENLHLFSVPKTSGKRGIHVLVPLASGYSHEEANAFACNIAGAVAAHVPAITVERALAKRRGRLYLDCMQNGYGKTIVAPYSLRAIDGAPVSAPLEWKEVTRKLDPLKFNLRTMPARLAKVGDLFADVLKRRQKLPELAG